MNLFKKNKTVNEILPDFLMEKEMTVQHRSYVPYVGQTRVFITWLKNNNLESTPINKISQDNITNFFYYLGREKKLDKPTCEKYFLVLRQLFQFAQKRGELNYIPFDNVVLPRKKKDQGAGIIYQDDLKILLTEIKEKDPQLYLGCMIQYYCFIRPGRELRLLKIGDIDCKQGIITVRQENAKNKLKQVVTMPIQLIEICKEYNIDKELKDLFVFGKRRRFNKKPVSVNMLSYRFKQFRDKFNMSKMYKFYSFKHTGASNLHISGISMRELMDQLRHTKLEATQHYLKKHCGIVNDRIRDHFPNPY